MLDVMESNRLEFALLHLKPTLWEHFEQLASKFLADEYPSLRTLAGQGDRGRDAMLWQPRADPSVVLQYSISQDWSKKILSTAKTIHHEFPDMQVLIYVTSLRIGPKADELRTVLRKKYRLFLDVRDSTWFIERQNRSRLTVSAADEFSSPIIEPLLAESSLIRSGDGKLTADEARAAVVFLSMQWEDRSREKGLTKLSFEALVKAALRDTDNDRRMPRAAVCDSVKSMIEHENQGEINQYINSALERLKGRQIRHWLQTDEFCLAFEERKRRTTALIKFELLENELNRELLELLERSSTAIEQGLEVSHLESLVPYVRRALEAFWMQKGEAFVHSLSNGQIVLFSEEAIDDICKDQLGSLPPKDLRAVDIIPVARSAIEELLVRPSAKIQQYLRALADGYTLFAFLQQVPDVQRSIQKMFSHGKVWLDTTAVLPLLAEMLLDEEERSYTRTLRTAREAGMVLYVTPGVIEELYHHIRHARLCQQLGPEWRNRTPFLFAAYLWSGRPAAEFKGWTIEFIGDHQPRDDISDFLAETADITKRSLAADVERAGEALRWKVTAYWEELHLARSQAIDGSRDPEVAKKLAAHDIENFLGVIMARRDDQPTHSLGHEHWWLTLDRSAFRATEEICEQQDIEPFDSPVMSYDFLIDYVAFGPQRADVKKTEERLLPLMLDMSLIDGIPQDILDIADTTRREMERWSERLVRREIRDRLNAAKWRRGPVSRAGFEAVDRDLQDALRRSR